MLIKSLIAKKLDIKDEDLLFMILVLYTSVVSSFGIKVITKNIGFVLVLYLFRDISSFKSEKGDNIKLHVQASYINKKDQYLYR